MPDNYVQFTLHNTRAHENARFRFKLPWLQAACGRDTPVGRQQSYHSPCTTRQRQELSQGIVWPREPLTKVRAKLRHSLPLLVLLLLFPNELLFILYLLYTHPRILYIHVYKSVCVCTYPRLMKATLLQLCHFPSFPNKQHPFHAFPQQR